MYFLGIRNYLQHLDHQYTILSTQNCILSLTIVCSMWAPIATTYNIDVATIENIRRVRLYDVGCEIRNIATNVAPMFTRTLPIVFTSSKLWSQEQPFIKVWAYFLRFTDSSKQIQFANFTIPIGLACWNRKI